MVPDGFKSNSPEYLWIFEGNCMAAGEIDMVKSDTFGARVTSKIPLANIEVTL